MEKRLIWKCLGCVISVVILLTHFEYQLLSSELWLLKHQQASVTVSHIPRDIYITDKRLGHVHCRFIDHLRELNPGYNIYFFDDGDAISYISKEFGEKYTAVYRMINKAAHRADFWRYLILSRRGGYYIDRDNWPMVPMHNISRAYDFVSIISATDPYGRHIHQGFLACRPGNWIMQRAIEHFLRFPNPPMNNGNVTKYSNHYYIASLTQMVENELKPSELRALTPQTAGGLNMYFLYHERPYKFVIDGYRNMVMLMSFKEYCGPFGWAVGRIYIRADFLEGMTKMPAGYPFRFNLSTNSWKPSRLPWDCINRTC